MAHLRQAIRDNIKTTITGLSETAGRVYANRVYPVAAPRLPCLLIYTESERINVATQRQPRTQRRTLSVNIEIYVKGTTNYDSQLDSISAEIEAALASDITCGGHAHDVLVTGFNAQYSGDGDQPVAVGVMTVEVTYMTAEGSPIVN